MIRIRQQFHGLGFARSLRAITALACLFTPLYSHADSPVADEYTLRSAVVYRLIQFSQWPLKEERYVTLCTAGEARSGLALKALDGAPFQGDTSISVQELNHDASSNCDVVVLGPNEKPEIAELIHNQFVICSGCSHNRDIAAIDLFVHENRLSYSVNQSVAVTNGVNFKTSLLRSASHIEGLE